MEAPYGNSTFELTSMTNQFNRLVYWRFGLDKTIPQSTNILNLMELLNVLWEGSSACCLTV
eukprot:TRINITY_DN16617_c0_g1_i1.p2 TRINITY_DN16617_c0_g1~~TRINITY_DN16617_c0_g1_i1.p2  ORF type:complete len:61 (-),score=4.04 TRINITY_DN16617_c0_g1_i1:316-498(-)